MGRGLFTACLLAPVGCPAPHVCLGGCCGNTHGWTKLWTFTWGWKGYPKKTVLPYKVWGGCSAVPMPAPFHMELQPPDIQVMLCCLPSVRARAAKEP